MGSVNISGRRKKEETWVFQLQRDGKGGRIWSTPGMMVEKEKKQEPQDEGDPSGLECSEIKKANPYVPPPFPQRVTCWHQQRWPAGRF